MKKNTKIILSCAAFLACFTAGVGASVGTAYEATTKLFDGNGVSVQTEQSYGAEKGTLLTAKRGGAYANYVETVSGIFSTRFSLPEEYGDEIAFTFSDKSSEDEFTLSVQTDKSTNEFSVSSNGVKAGLYYGAYGTVSGVTATMNGDGYYTRLQKGDFVTVAFDPNTMCVYADNVLVWNFLSEYNDGAKFGKVMEGFASYDVTVSFPKVVDGKAEMLVYELLGQKTDGKYLKQDTASPLIYADLKLNAVRRRAYAIPEPTVYDLGDGRIASENVRVVVSNAKGEKLVDEKFEDGLSFVPQAAGKYKISYSVSDGSGNTGNTAFEIVALEASPEPVFELSQTIEDETVGLGASIRLPSATVESELFTANTSYVPYVRVYNSKNEVAFEAAADKNTLATLTQNGRYTVVYERTVRGVQMREERAVVTVDGTLPTFGYAELNDEYVVGEVIEIPSVAVSLGDKKAEAEATVTFPDGSTYYLATLCPTMAGEYTVTWRAEIGGERYVKERSFFVNVSPENVFESGSGALKSEFADYAYDVSLSGLKVELMPDTPAVYAETVDFEKLGASDTLVEFIAVSPVVGKLLYNKVYVTLRDANDYSNYFTIQVDGNLSPTQSALTVRTHNGSEFYGMNGSGTISKNGYTGIRHSFSSTSIVGYSAAQNTVEIRYDYQNGKLYVRGESGEFGLAADFTNESFTKIAGTFDGFKDGKAKIEISFAYLDTGESVWHDQAYYYNSAELLLLQLAGYGFTNGKIADGEKPQIYVDEPIVLPSAVVGKEYAVFEAEAFDRICGKTAVNVRAVYNYGKSSYLDMQLKNGAFVPVYEGEYTLVYTAVDESGNVAEYLIKVNALKTNPNDLAVTLGEETVGELLTGIPVELRGVTPTGGVGGVYVTTVEVLDPNGDSIPVSDGAFTPNQAGAFTVSYTVKDYVGNTTGCSYQVNVASNDVPYFTEEIKLVPVMTAGRSASLPLLKAYDYSSFPAKEITPDVYVRYPNESDYDGEKITLDGFTPDPERVAHGDELEFKYVWTGENGELEKTAKCLVSEIVTTDVVLSDYFVYENVESTLASSYLRLTAKNGGRATFGKNIIANGFSMKTTLQSTNISSLVLTLTDVKDPTIALKVRFYAAGGTYYLQVNGGAAYSIASVATGRVAEFSYNVATQSVSLKTNITSSRGNTTLIEVKETAYGEPFNGFTGRFLTAELAFTVSGENGVLDISQIGNQNVSDKTRDNTGPAIWVLGEYMGTIREGESFTIPAAIAGDVLSYPEAVTVSVSTPDGASYTVSEDGVTLDGAPADREYVIRPTELGRYTIDYACEDENGRKAKFVSRPLYVVEGESAEALEIVLSGKMPTTGKVNKTVKLPTATSSDGKACTLSIAVYSPKGTPVDLNETGGFMPEVKGVYRVRYMLHDGSNRLAMQEYSIKVS